MANKIFVLSAISATQKTEEDIEKEYRKAQIESKNWESRSIEKYRKFLEGWHEDKYKIGIYDTGFFTTLERAKESAKNNEAGIFEAGLYPYIVVRSMPTETMYADSEGDDYHLYRYNIETDVYDPIPWEGDSEYTSEELKKVIMQQFDGIPGDYEHCHASEHGWRWEENTEKE